MAAKLPTQKIVLNKISDSASIVLLGSFNPGIFHPAWFEKHGLLPQSETSDAKIEIASNDVAIFTMSWARIEVIGSRFIVKTIDESKFGPLRDLVIAIFQLLEFTPISQIGINREIKYQLPNVETWHSIGHTLAPKEHWLNYVKSPGMKSISIQADRDDDRKGILNITVSSLADPPFSVVTAINDHVELDANSTAADVNLIIMQDWEKSLNRAEKIASGLISEVSQPK